MPDILTRIQCPACWVHDNRITALVFKNQTDEQIEDFLKLNGWQLDHMHWICGDHDIRPRNEANL